jgi:hypothetical protein
MDKDTPDAGPEYRPPLITFVGHLAELTRVVPPVKDVGAFDGTTYLGQQLGS